MDEKNVRQTESEVELKRVCKICGETEAQHHEPKWLEIPAGCVCNWREWDYHGMDVLPKVCGNYIGDGKMNCRICEHDKECHV